MSDAATVQGNESRSAAGGRNPWLIAIVVSIATFMLVLDTSIANVALRNIAGSLAAGMDESTWVITTYLVANSVIIPVSGWLTSVVGRKRYYMICVATFTFASLLCGLAPNLPTLIAFRILQGLGGGGMAPSEQSILADTFPPEKRSQAFALYGIAVIVAPTVGPTIGGWLTDNFSWHWIFFINVPFGIMSLALVQWLVIEPDILERERRERLSKGLRVDWIGFILVAMALGCLEVFLDEGQRNDWFASTFITAFVVISAVSFLLLVPWEWTRREPIVDIRLLFSRQFGMSFLVMMAVGAVLFSTTQLLPQLQQTTFDYTATLSGLSMMPGGIAMLMLMPISGFAAGVVQPRHLIMLGMSVIAVALWHTTSLTPDAKLQLLRLCPRLYDDRPAVPVYPDLHRRLCRPAAAEDRPGIVADQCRAQHRRQHRRVAVQHGDCPERPDAPVGAGRPHRAIERHLSADASPGDGSFRRRGFATGRGQAAGCRLDRPGDRPPGFAARLCRCVFLLRDSHGGAGAVRFAAQTAQIVRQASFVLGLRPLGRLADSPCFTGLPPSAT